MKKLFLISLFITLLCFITLLSCGQRTQWVGKIIEVSSWSGDARCLTKTKHSNRDTFIYVQPQHRQIFTVGETITFYTGGDLFSHKATTNSK